MILAKKRLIKMSINNYFSNKEVRSRGGACTKAWEGSLAAAPAIGRRTACGPNGIRSIDI
jgi:hypothetical protein